MRIKEIKIPDKESEPFGLKSVSMKRLGKVVAIAGKNGAGKTRLLQLIKAQLDKSYFKFGTESIKDQTKEDDKYYEKIKLDRDFDLGLISKDDYLEELNILLSEQDKKEAELNEGFISDNLKIYGIPNDKNLKVIDFSNVKKELLNIKNESLIEIKNHIRKCNEDEISNYNILTPILIQDSIKAKKHFEKSDTTVKLAFEQINSRSAELLESEIEFDEDNNIFLFGKDIYEKDNTYSGLSDGQKIILQYLTAFENLKDKLSNRIIYIDEPENYIYPEQLINFISELINNIEDGQIWITTHSIPLLSSFDPSWIYYIEKGELTYKGNVPEKVITGLIGGDKNKINLENFLSLPSIFAANRFAYQCLFPPETLLTNKHDPQTNQVIEAIKLKLESKDSIRILDIGCGKGRLFNAIYENLKSHPVLNQIEYYGFDIDLKDLDDFTGILSKHYTNTTQRHFIKYDKLQEEFDEESFDLIVLVNVLHEIHPDYWLTTFSKSSTPFKLLSENGTLLIVEDHHMHIGERAHKDGFFLMNTTQIKKLFQIKESDADESFRIVSERNERLKAHYISKSLVGNINQHTKLEAIKSLKTYSLENIERLRNLEQTHKIGKLIGLNLMQLANCNIYLNKNGI